MDLRLVRYFQVVAEELSFSRASRRLRIAQPALSRAVRNLEESLGTKLLNRNRRSVSLTPAGSVLLDHAALLFDRINELSQKVQRTGLGEEGELRLGYIGPPTLEFLGRLLAEFHSRHPRVQIVLEERTPERVCEMVARGRLAVGLTRPAQTGIALGLSTKLLRSEPLCAALPAGHRLSDRRRLAWKDLSEDPLILLSRREGMGLHDTIVAACRRAGFAPRIVHTPSVIGTVLAYVEAGAGIGIIPESVAALGAGQPITFHRLTPRHFVELVVVWSEAHRDPVADAFRHLLLDWQTNNRLWRSENAAQSVGLAIKDHD